MGSDAETFAAAVTCIDGRTHGPLTDWVRERFGVDHVDLITRPGVDATLSDCSGGLCEGIREHLAVSATAHASRVVAIAGHDDCAGNPVPADEHRRQIAEAVGQVRGWELGMDVIGVWIERDGTVTQIEVLAGTGVSAGAGDAPPDEVRSTR